MPLTKSGYVSSKSAPSGKTWKRHLKLEKLARLIAAGYSDIQCAQFLDITVQYVSMLKRSTYFQAVQMEVATGVISQIDIATRNDLENGLEALREMAPSALLALKDSVLDKSNPKLRFEAAKEILDREGSLAKVSKSEIKHTEEIDFSHHDLIATDLFAAIMANTSTNNATVGEAGVAEGVGTASAAFDADKSLEIQSKFVQAGLSADAQSEMHKHIKLEEFELPKGAKAN